MKINPGKKKTVSQYFAVTPRGKKYKIINPFSEELKINGHKEEIKIFED